MKCALVMMMVLWSGLLWAQGVIFPIPEKSVQTVAGDRKCAFVMIDCLAGGVSRYNQEGVVEKLPPCSTFKIWNALIGLESGIISSPEEVFYKWDGTTRFLPEWNQDLTLKQAFQSSCVPAFQNLARKIGAKDMQSWVDKLEFGDRDLSAGVDVFWLPAKGRKTILVSPEEQVNLICKLVAGKLPFSGKAQAGLKAIMHVRKSERGTLYGKTGSGADEAGVYNLGWFVGYVENNGKNYAFACAVRGERLMGKDARSIVEAILEKNGYL